MRGKAFCDRHSVDQVGITPAYAGKSQKTALQKLPRQDPPRLCGEKRSLLSGGGSPSGSPPPMRGKGQIKDCRECVAQDHPRLCGEKLWHSATRSAMKGSPPPMRGKVWRQCYRDSSIGITPAYAGKRNNPIQKWKWNRDHPRLCGEKSLGRCIRRRCEGSPPPMRGKGKQRGVRLGHGRITPAYAGKR